MGKESWWLPRAFTSTDSCAWLKEDSLHTTSKEKTPAINSGCDGKLHARCTSAILLRSLWKWPANIWVDLTPPPWEGVHLTGPEWPRTQGQIGHGHKGNPNSTVLLKECSHKMIPNNILLYSWISASLSRDPLLNNMQKSGKPRNTWSKMGYLHQIFPHKAQRTLQMRRWKYYRSQCGWKTSRKQGLQATTGLMHIWTHRYCENM